MLNQLQQDFQHYLLTQHQDIHKNIVSTEKMSADKRLLIYENAYYARLVEALAVTYPAIHTYLGFDDFYQVSAEYAKTHPSTYRSIRWFGDRFAQFLQYHDDYQDYPHLAEMAEIEWTMSLVFDAKDGLPLTLEALALIPPPAWEDMRILLHPSVRRIHLDWNSIAIWQDLIKNKTPALPIKNKFTVDWIFWRHQLDNHYCSLAEEEAWAIDAITKGENFGTICEGLLQWNKEDDVALRAASLLKGWTEAGLIAQIV